MAGTESGAWRSGFAPPLLTAVLIGLVSVPIPHGAVRAQEAAAATGDPEQGQKLFGREGCNGCHTIDGVGGQVGPELTGVFQLDLAMDRPGQEHANVADYVRESIEDPQAYIVPGFPQPSPMPTAETFGLSEQEIDDLVAYLEQEGGT